MAEPVDIKTNPLTKIDGGLLRPGMMTAAERAKGRFMRAPDGHGGGDPPPADPPADDPPADPPADPAPSQDDPPAPPSDDSTILGDDPNPDGDPPADDATAPETYELKPPEGFEKLDEESVALATPVFKELGLTNDQANKLMPVAGKFAERIIAQQNQAIMDEVQTTRKAWAEEAQNDPEIGGAKFEETKALSAKALDALGYPKGSPFRSFLTDSGLGNHPEMIRAMRKVGELVSEDGDFVRSNAGAQSKPDRLATLYPDDVPKEGAN